MNTVTKRLACVIFIHVLQTVTGASHPNTAYYFWRTSACVSYIMLAVFASRPRQEAAAVRSFKNEIQQSIQKCHPRSSAAFNVHIVSLQRHTQRSFYTHTEAFTDSKLWHTEALTQRSFYTRQPFTQRSFHVHSGNRNLIAFGKPAAHREVAPREFDVHSRWTPEGEAEEKKREENRREETRREERRGDEKRRRRRRGRRRRRTRTRTRRRDENRAVEQKQLE